MPHLKELLSKLDEEKFVFISITDEKADVIEEFLAKRKMPSCVGIDEDQSSFADYGVSARPMTFVINPDGIVVMNTRPSLLRVADLQAIAAGEFDVKKYLKEKENIKLHTAGNDLPQIGGFAPGHDPYIWPWIQAGKASRFLQYQSTIRKAESEGNGGGQQVTPFGGVGITLTGRTPAELMAYAFEERSPHRFEDPDGLLPDSDYDLIYSRPRNSNLDAARADIQNMVSEMFGIEFESIKETRVVLLLSFDSEAFQYHEKLDWSDPAIHTLLPVDFYLQDYETQTGNLIELEKGESKNWYVDIFDDKNSNVNGEAVKDWLESKGASLNTEKRELKLWRIKRTR